MKGWTQWEQTVGGMVCHNARRRLRAEAARGAGDTWVVTVRGLDDERSAWSINREPDEALAAAVALLPRKVPR